MNPTTTIVLLTVLSTVLGGILLYIHYDSKNKLQALKVQLQQALSAINAEKETIQQNKEITIEELKNNRKELDKVIKSLSKVETTKIPIEQVRQFLTGL